MFKWLKKLFESKPSWEKCEMPRWFRSKRLERTMSQVHYFNGKTYKYKAVYDPDWSEFSKTGGHWSVYDYTFYRKLKKK